MAYMLGHPIELSEEELKNFEIGSEEWKGLSVIECDISPPQNLDKPLLHRKCEQTGLLLFDLVRRTGVYTSEEIKKALDLGYYIHEIK